MYQYKRRGSGVGIARASLYCCHGKVLGLRMERELELVVDAETDDVVGARVGLFAVVGLLVVVAVDANEIAGIQADLLVNVPGTTESDAVAIAGERGILLVTVRESVVCALTATTDGELVVNVIFDTSQELVGSMGELFLTIVGHLGILIVEEVILKGGTELGGELVTDCYREQCGHVVACTNAVLKGGSQTAHRRS